MFKLLVSCAIFAAASAAEVFLQPQPNGITTFYNPTAYSTIGNVAGIPLTTAYNTPLLNGAIYSAGALPLAGTHFIKKRSVGNFIAGSPYFASGPLVASTYNTPLISSAPVLSAAPLPYAYPSLASPVHLIKKRSVGSFIAPSTYIAPTSYAATAPLVTSTYAATAPLYPSAPFISSVPIGHAAFIK